MSSPFSLQDLLSQLGESKLPTPTPIHEAQVATLVEIYSKYADFMEGCAFSAGDLVTPSKTSTIRGSGDPYIVLEVLEDKDRSRLITNDVDEVTSYQNGAHPDMRVLCYSANGLYTPFLVESWHFELYVDTLGAALSAEQPSSKHGEIDA